MKCKVPRVIGVTEHVKELPTIGGGGDVAPGKFCGNSTKITTTQVVQLRIVAGSVSCRKKHKFCTGKFPFGMFVCLFVFN